MDFFDRQAKARRSTKQLVFYFALAVTLTAAFIYAAFALILLRGELDGGSLRDLWHPPLAAGVAAGTLAVVALGSLYKTSQLSAGGASVARLLGGRPVDANAIHPDERKLCNVVEEMAIASGVPVPELFLLPDEEGINAFAAGFSTQDAAIGVTRGCMTLLDRDELQGVIAHEFSHILNGDMRLNLRLIGIVHGLICITIIGRMLLRTGYYSRRRYYCLGASSRGKGGNPLPLLGLALILVGAIGVLCGRLIKSAVSRQREYLADASAVQFTRNPAGLAGALKKIGGLVHGSRLQNAHAEEASHLLFGNGLKPSWLQAFATHPPLADRIRAIDPLWDGNFSVVTSVRSRPAAPPPILAGQRGAAAAEAPWQSLSDARPAHGAVPFGDSKPSTEVAALLAQIGHPTGQHLDHAVRLMAALPGPVAKAARDPGGACALIYGLLLSRQPSARPHQLRDLKARLDPALRRELEALLTGLDDVPENFRLPLASLTTTALRRLSAEQYNQFREISATLIASDQEVDLFEFALLKMVTRHLDPHFGRAPRRTIQYYSWKPLLTDAAVLLSALSHAGHGETSEAQRAFDEGVRRLPAAGRVMMRPMRECDLRAIDAALERFSEAGPPMKRTLLLAGAHTVAADGKVAVREAELLRAMADALDCPIPPLI